MGHLLGQHSPPLHTCLLPLRLLSLWSSLPSTSITITIISGIRICNDTIENHFPSPHTNPFRRTVVSLLSESIDSNSGAQPLHSIFFWGWGLRSIAFRLRRKSQLGLLCSKLILTEIHFKTPIFMGTCIGHTGIGSLGYTTMCM